MKFDPTTRTLTLEPTDCRQCRYQEPQGTIAAMETCPTCGGSGRGTRGGARRCKGGCFGSGQIVSRVERALCPACRGKFVSASQENWTDTAPLEAVQALPIRVVVANRDSTWNERHLGLGSIWSTTDYGQRWDDAKARVMADPNTTTDEVFAPLVEEVRSQLANERVQACKIVRDRESLVLHDEIVVILHRGGYTVVANTPSQEA